MEITRVLKGAGLDEKEAGVYLALLELGTASVQGIAQKAAIKRPTTYLVLDELVRKGLVATVPRAKKTLYTAENPEKLLAEQHKKQELLKRYMPEMLAHFNAKKDKPLVQMFEGTEGIVQVYNKIYAAKEVWFYGTAKEALTYNPQELDDFVERCLREGFTVRDLLAQNPEDLAYAKRAKKAPNYEIRFLPKSMPIMTDNAIFGDTVVFFSFHPTVFAVTITGREVSAAIRTLYEFAWAAGIPADTLVK